MLDEIARLTSPTAMEEGGDSSEAAANKREWVLDSFAWNHETSDLQLLHDLRLLQSHQEIADDRPLRRDDDLLPSFLWCGSARSKLLEVSDVRYNPGEAMNVISVAQLARRHGLVMVLEPRWGYVRAPATHWAERRPSPHMQRHVRARLSAHRPHGASRSTLLLHLLPIYVCITARACIYVTVHFAGRGHKVLGHERG